MVAAAIERFADLFLRSAEGARLLASDEEARNQERSDAATAVKKIDADLLRELPALTKSYETALAEEKAAALAFRDAQIAAQQAWSARSRAIARADIARDSRLKILRETADESIAALRAELSAAHLQKIDVDQNSPDYNKKMVAMNQAMLAAIRELGKLPEESLTTSMLATRLAEIRASVGMNGEHNGNGHSH